MPSTRCEDNFCVVSGAFHALPPHELAAERRPRTSSPPVTPRTRTSPLILSAPILWERNCQLDDVPVLVVALLLKLLGDPPQKSVKFFAALEVLEQARDWIWLAKITNVLCQHWQKKNATKLDCRLRRLQPLLEQI